MTVRGATGRWLAFAAAILPIAPAASVQDNVPAHPDNGGPLLFEVTADRLNLRQEAGTASSVVVVLNRGRVLNNLGCERVAERVWCDVQPLGGGPRGYAAASFLRPAVSPHGAVSYGPDTSALRAGQGNFDATGPVPCSRQAGGALGTCQMGVARHPGGFATVVVTHPDGRQRMLFFQNGVAIGADTSEADNPGPFRSSRSGDAYVIRVGPERYTIADMVVFGG